MKKKILLRMFHVLARRLEKKGVTFFLFMKREKNHSADIFTSLPLKDKQVEVIVGEIIIQLRTVSELQEEGAKWTMQKENN